MLILESGTYLANVQSKISLDGIQVSNTIYRYNSLFEVMHAHENPHLSFVLTGGNLEKRKHAELERLPGALTFYHSGEMHQNIHGRWASAHLNVEFEPGFLKRHALYEDNLASLTQPDAKFLMLRIYRELLNADDLSEIGLQSTLLNLVQHAKKTDYKKPAWICRLEEKLRAHFEDSLTLQELSVAAGVHPTTISTHFPKYFHCTLSDFIRKLRIGKAIGMIRTGNHTLTEVAVACGFADQSHFIRNFKNYTGFLPGQFQKL